MDTYTPDIEEKHKKPLMTGKELAQLLDVSAPTLSEAAKKGYNCAGYPVIEWAEFNNSGRIEGYDVPGYILYEKQKNSKKRPNPKPETLNKPNLAADEGNSAENPQESPIVNNYSLLPQGENYANPVGMASLSIVLKHALGNDTPQSRAVIGGTLALLGAITAHSITDSGPAAGIGAAAGLGIALYFFKNSKYEGVSQKNIDSQPFENPQYLIKPLVSSSVHSGYLVS